jgi:hypothetical protein
MIAYKANETAVIVRALSRGASVARNKRVTQTSNAGTTRDIYQRLFRVSYVIGLLWYQVITNLQKIGKPDSICQ